MTLNLKFYKRNVNAVYEILSKIHEFFFITMFEPSAINR